jgi:hypothetical protein
MSWAKERQGCQRKLARTVADYIKGICNTTKTSLKEELTDYLTSEPYSESWCRVLNYELGYPMEPNEAASYAGSPEEIRTWLNENSLKKSVFNN